MVEMDCILIFDQLNDLLFIKCNEGFMKLACKLAVNQGLVGDNISDDKHAISPNVLMQLFSPIVTSQRIMAGQFGNSYSSIQCDNGTNMAFNEYMGYLFVQIGTQTISTLTRRLSMCTTFVKYISGPNVPLLRCDIEKTVLLTRIIDTWQQLKDSDQAVLVEAVEQLQVNSEICSATLKALKDSVERFVSKTDHQRVHAMILVENKFLSLYSSRSASDLSAEDILFLGLLNESISCNSKDSSVLNTSESEGELRSDISFNLLSTANCRVSNLSKGPPGVDSFLVLLSGNRPHAIHISMVSSSVSMLLLFECGSDVISLSLNDAFHSINALQTLQNQKDMENVNHAFHFLDISIKKVFDGLKKASKAVDTSLKVLRQKWDQLRKAYIEFIKTSEPSLIIKIESTSSIFMDCLRNIHKLTCLDDSMLNEHHSLILSIHSDVKYRLQDFSEFLRVKALRNFTLGSRSSLSINKYLEEFPGLVHFLYIDRNTHRLTAPSLDFNSEDTASLTKKKIWTMVDFVRCHLQEGHLAMMWKDTTFNYAYFLWFEDSSGSPIKPKIFPASVMKNCPLPGIMADDFYKRLVEGCFPKINSKRVHVYELYCIHLGLATASCVLEHSRRLAATIWEVTGVPSNPSDFL